jgi:hypothetical protein|tara:strand:+ start:4573 stop:5085 length:513 start_codon:yes stop_codon:yes gene_type:complete
MAANLGIIIENAGGDDDFKYFALKTEDVAIQIARTPLQIPVPQGSPFIFDIGSYRPSITLSGIVDDVDTGDSITFNGSGSSLTYYVPTMFQLQVLATDWVHRQSTQFVYILHSNYNGSAAATQYYDKYECAIQQCKMNLQAGTETKWEYTLQFVSNRLIPSAGAKSENKA